MSYKVGVVKKITFLFMTMALAVALVACQGAVGKTGEPGPKGEPGNPAPPAPAPNLAPQARSLTFDAMQLREGGDADTVNVAVNFFDQDGDDAALVLSFRVEQTARFVDVELDVDAGVLTVTPVDAGEAVITVTATDAGGLTASATLTVTVVDAGDPMYIGSLSGETLTFGGRQTIPGSVIESSFDGEDLRFSAETEHTTIVDVDMDNPDDPNEVTITALQVEGTATVTITATDEDGDTASESIHVEVRASLAPVVSDVMPDPVTLDVGGDPSMPVNVASYFDNHGLEALTYVPTADSEAVSLSDVVDGMLTITPVSADVVVVTITATNMHGSAMQTIDVTVNATPPTTVGTIPTVILMSGNTRSVGLASYFAGDGLTYSVSGQTSAVGARVIGDTLLIEALMAGPATATLTVTAMDADGETVTQDVMVTVEAEEPPEQNMAPELKPGKMIGPFIGEPANFATTAAIDLDEYFTDPDGADALLTYKVTQDKMKEILDTPVTGTTSVIAVGGGTAPSTCTGGDDTAATGDGTGAMALPDGTDLGDDTLWICYHNPGTAEIKIVAIDVSGTESDPVTVTITVVETGSIVAPVADPVVTDMADAAYNPITDVDGDPDATTRLKIGKSVKVIDDKAIDLYFSDADFSDHDRDMLKFTVKHFAADAALTPGPITQAVLEGATAITDSTKHQVMASLMAPTWDGGSDDKFTLTLTPQNAGTAVQQIALIATDMYGLSAARVFNVRVNHKPKAQGAQKEPLTLGDATKFDDNTPLLSLTPSAAESTKTLTLVENMAGYFSDGDGPEDLAGAVGTALTGRWCEAERSFTGDEAPAAVSFTRGGSGDTSTLGVTITLPAASDAVYGRMTISIRCRDAADEWSERDTLQIEVKDLSGGSIQ